MNKESTARYMYLVKLFSIQVCMAHAPKTGGMMELGELRNKLIKSRGRSALNQVMPDASLVPVLPAAGYNY